MAASVGNRTTVFASGTIYWCKLLGEPRLNYEGTNKEWTVEFEPDDPSFLKRFGLLDRLKKKYEDRGPYLTLRKKAIVSVDGTSPKPVRVYNSAKEAWDQNTLIGNGSRGDVKLTIVDWGKGKKQSIYLTALRITDHVPYISNEFAGMDGEAEPPKESKEKKSKAAKEDVFQDLPDDDNPF